MVERLRIIGCAVLEKSPGNEFFSLDQIVEITGLDRIAVRRSLEQFSREKLILKLSKRPTYLKAEIGLPKGRPPLAITYHVKNKKKLRDRVIPKLKEQTAQDRMWSVIRNKQEMDGHFTVRDVIILSGTKREHARWFVKMLRRGGFVKPSKPGGPGVTWTLIKDPGPRRPYVGGKEEGIKDAKNRKDQAAED